MMLLMLQGRTASASMIHYTAKTGVYEAASLADTGIPVQLDRVHYPITTV